MPLAFIERLPGTHTAPADIAVLPPHTSSFSTMTTRCPRSDARSAAHIPAPPDPITTTSAVSSQPPSEASAVTRSARSVRLRRVLLELDDVAGGVPDPDLTDDAAVVVLAALDVLDAGGVELGDRGVEVLDADAEVLRPGVDALGQRTAPGEV